jgi:hypothetical protein
MTTQRLLKRCATLELLAQEVRRPQQRAEERHQEWLDNILKLFAVFPEARHEELLALLGSDRWEGSALAELLNWITTGSWQPVPIPPAAADVFLTDPWAKPKARCGSCGTFLPLRWGIWTNGDTGQSWQAPLKYFRRCPCGGVIHHVGGGPVEERLWIPEHVVPPWTFTPDGC